MEKYIAPYRPMRWYDWLVVLLLLGLVAGARAESVYKCVDADGGIAYQSKPCAPQQSASVVEIVPPPARTAPVPHYALARPAQETPPREPRRLHRRAAADVGYECRAGDGRTFYRLGACPHSIAATDSASPRHGRGSGRGSGRSVSVMSRAIPREQACMQMHRAGAIGRDGHELDKQVSTYERDLGHNPCR